MARHAYQQILQGERPPDPSARVRASQVPPVWVTDASMLRSAKWRLLAADELARPCFMRLEAIRDGPRVTDFAWDSVDARAARMLQHSVGELVGHRLLDRLAGHIGHRWIFAHYRRVLETGVAEASLQLYVDHGKEDICRHGAHRAGDGVAVVLLNLSAARRARVLRSELERDTANAEWPTLG